LIFVFEDPGKVRYLVYSNYGNVRHQANKAKKEFFETDLHESFWSTTPHQFCHRSKLYKRGVILSVSCYSGWRLLWVVNAPISISIK